METYIQCISFISDTRDIGRRNWGHNHNFTSLHDNSTVLGRKLQERMIHIKNLLKYLAKQLFESLLALALFAVAVYVYKNYL